jgi:hypothetical protein
MKKLLLLLVIGIASAHAGAAEYRSSFGFPFELSSDWLVLTPTEVTKLYRDETLDSLDIDADPATAQGILERVKRGEIEFYFDRKHSTRDFKNNISVQLMQGGQPYTTEAARQVCRLLPEELPRVFGSAVEIASCGTDELHGVRVMTYEYFVPAQQVHVVQYEIPYLSDTTLVLVGGAHPAALDYLRSAQASIADRIAKFASESQLTLPGSHAARGQH